MPLSLSFGVSLSANRTPAFVLRNMLTATEEFNAAAWTKLTTTVTANAGGAPNGTTTADKLIGTAGATNMRIIQTKALTGGVTYAYSIYAKAAEYSNLRVQRNDANLNLFTHNFDLSAGSVSGGGVIADIGDGWYRCSGAIVCNTSATTGPLFVMQPGATGDATSGLLIWGAQLEVGSAATGYQRVAA